MPELLPGAEGFPHTSILSDKVQRVLGLNPSAFTGPGTNTYLVGTGGPDPLLIDTGAGLPEYVELLRGHLAEQELPPLRRILLTHVHGDHIGGAADVLGLNGDIPVHKFPWPEKDAQHAVTLEQVSDGDRFAGRLCFF